MKISLSSSNGILISNSILPKNDPSIVRFCGMSLKQIFKVYHSPKYRIYIFLHYSFCLEMHGTKIEQWDYVDRVS